MRPAPAAVVFVADVPRMARFYRELLSMRVLHDASDHVVLECDGMQLTIHALHGEPSTADAPRFDTYIKLCFPVHAIADIRARAPALGGALWGIEKEWKARGFSACDGRDPEGNIFQVREAAA
jgi:catechol 2,3-dioxygenase-like lactoylglutathione lyase family enzyme